MPVEVLTETDKFLFENADKWVIDDEGILHIVGTSGNLASYNRGIWQAICKGSPTLNPWQSR